MTSSFPAPTPGSGPNARLNGWKEIAAHFGRGVRTVQRWEKAFGMPVYRIGTGRGENVHAFSVELDAWLATAARSRDLADQPGDTETPEVNGAVPVTTEVPAPRPDAPPVDPIRRRVVVRRITWLTLTAVVLAAGATLAWLATRPPPTGSGSRPTGVIDPSRRQPSFGVASGDTLLVYDAEKRFLWRRQFDGPLGFDTEAPQRGRGRRLWFQDVNGDGVREVLVFAPVPGSGWPITLFCLAADDGHDVWTRTPRESVRFGGTTYSPPWSGHWIFMTGSSRAPALWVTWTHIESGFFPCLVERLSGKDGQPQSEYWSAGYVELVIDATVQGRPSILVGAANNDHLGASLAVFDADGVMGSAPAENPDKVCGDCPPGGPRAFLVFPQMELSRLEEGYPAVLDVRTAVSGELSVWVNHHSESGTGVVSYQLDRNLHPVSAELGSGYRVAHKALEEAGHLKHRLGDRDHAELFPVLVYDGTRFVKVTGRITR